VARCGVPLSDMVAMQIEIEHALPADCHGVVPACRNTVGWRPVHVSEMKYLDLHGERVAYREAGSGEALLLIHGMAGSSATWRPVLPQLSKKYRVVAPDLFGHGESAKPRGDYSLGAFAVWLRDLLDELGITRATVIGQSLGGDVAMQLLSAPRLLPAAGSHQQRGPGPRPELDLADPVGTRSRAGGACGRATADFARRQQPRVVAHVGGDPARVPGRLVAPGMHLPLRSDRPRPPASQRDFRGRRRWCGQFRGAPARSR
jgi:pimeloyl-ACP methyl ester carboxylesterase